MERYLRIDTARLRLLWLSPETMRGLLSGAVRDLEGATVPDEWRVDAVPALRRRVAQAEGEPQSAPFLLRAIIESRSHRIIGRIGFHGPPGANGPGAPDALELGYWIEPASRRQGYAAEAVLGLMDWAASVHAIHRFVLSVGPWNVASLGLARKLGFIEVGRQMDEVDGEELVFELHADPTQERTLTVVAG